MNLKKYNESTGTWDIISSGNASGIMVTDPHFLEEGQTFKSVNQVLVDMDDKVEETKRNLSWVVLNGTIGGGGGGGGTTASIKLTDGSIVTTEGVHYLYSTSTKLTLHYLISSTKPNEKYNISVSLDGNTIISNQVGYSSVQGTLEIPNIAEFSSSASHSIVVTAENTEGISVSPYLLTVVESSISLESSVTSVTATIGLPYNITYKITNKVLGSETSLIVTNTTNGISKSYSVGKFTSVEPKLLDVNFFDLFNGATPTAGSSYTISAQATTSVDTQVIQSDTVTNKVVVEDGQTLVVLVDGITTQADIEAGTEPTEFAQSGNISFSFTPYLAGVSIIYYAIRIQRGTITTDIGNFDADSSNFNSNSYVLRGKAQVFSWSIPQEESYLGDYIITLRCWSEKGSPITDTILRCNVIAADQSLIPTQNPSNTMYAQWNIKQATFPQETSAKIWSSVVPNFIMPGQQEEQSVTTNLNVYDTNGILSGFLNENGQSKLRLAGEAYGSKYQTLRSLLKWVFFSNMVLVFTAFVGAVVALYFCTGSLSGSFSMDSIAILTRGFFHCVILAFFQVMLLIRVGETKCFGVILLLAVGYTFLKLSYSPLDSSAFLYRFALGGIIYSLLCFLEITALKKIYMEDWTDYENRCY